MRDNYLEEYYLFLRFPSVSTDDQVQGKAGRVCRLAGEQAEQDRSANAACAYETSSHCVGPQ